MITSARSGLHSVNTSDLATLVKQSVDIIDVIGQAVPLRRSGNRHIGLCPFHKEKTPSFHVDSSNQLYHCFGCGVGGDVLSFVMKYQNVPFMDAVKYLADRYHIALPETGAGGSGTGGALQVSGKEREELYAVLQMGGDFFYGQLKHAVSGRGAREYLLKRGISEEIVEVERLGYAPPEWDTLTTHLRRAGISMELGVKAGLLAISSKDARRFFDRFRNRLIFPIRDDRGRIVAFGGRSLSHVSRGEPKYLNSPETAVYQKGRMLYQMARARESCREVRQVVLVEGYMDLLAFHVHGFYRVAATLGTALTVQQIRILGRMADEVILAYDGDEAGEKAMLRALPLFLQEEVPVSGVLFPDGMDPDDFLGREGLEGFERLVHKRRDLGILALERALDAWDGSSAGKSVVMSRLQPIFDAVKQPLLRSEYLRIVSDRLSLSEKVIERQLAYGQRGMPRHPSGGFAPVSPCLEETPCLEERIVRLMVKYPELIEEVRDCRAVECFREAHLKRLAEALISCFDGSWDSSVAPTLYDRLPDTETRGLYTRFLMESAEIHQAGVHMEDWLEALQERQKKLECFHLREALRQAEQSGDMDRVKCLLAKIQELGITRKRAGTASEKTQGDSCR